MTLSKKILSTLLAALMLVTSLSVGFYASAALANESQEYDYLAEYLAKDYVAKKTNYDVEHKQDYTTVGWSEENNAFMTEHRVTAKDNLASDIFTAAEKFFYIANSIISYEYGKDSYNPEILKNTILYNLEPRMQYIAGTRVEPVDPDDPDGPTQSVQVKAYEWYNVESVITFFMGGATAVNSGNWYHKYIFHTINDINSVLLDIDEIESADPYLITRELTATFTFKKELDVNGVKSLYSFKALDLVIPAPVNDNFTITNLLNASYILLDPFASFWNSNQFVNMTDAQLSAWRNGAGSGFMSAYNLIKDYSSEVKYHLFGEHIGDIMHVLGNTTPISLKPQRANVRTNTSGQPVPYYTGQTVRTVSVTNPNIGGTQSVNYNKLDDVIAKIDQLLTGDALKPLIPVIGPMLLPEFTGNFANFNSITELLEYTIKDLLFSDTLITTLMSFLYPEVSKALYELEVVGTEFIDSIVWNAIENGNNQIYALPGSFTTQILGTNASPKSYSPTLYSGRGYADPTIKTNTSAHATLRAIFMAASNNHNSYSNGARYTDWDTFNWDNVKWGFEDCTTMEQREKLFYDSIYLVFRGLGAMWRALTAGEPTLGGQTAENRLRVIDAGGFIDVEATGRETYSNLFVPLFEVLGLTNAQIRTPQSYWSLNAGDMGLAIFMPLFDWVINDFLNAPVKTICNILPNLIHYLDPTTPYSPVRLLKGTAVNGSSCPRFSLKLDVQITLLWIGDVVTISDLYDLGDLVGDLLDGVDVFAMLESGLNGILGSDLLKLTGKIPVKDADGKPIIDPDTGEDMVREVPVKLPKLMLQKLLDCATLYTNTNTRCVTVPPINGAYPGGGASPERTKLYQVKNPGDILLYLLRFLLSSLEYRNFNGNPAAPFDEGMLANLFGVDMEQELVGGMTIGSLITNISCNFDEVICAIVELLYPNDNGNEYKNVFDSSPGDSKFIYDLTHVNYHKNVLIDSRTSRKFGPAVPYSPYWTRDNATYVVGNLDGMIGDVLAMLKLEGFESLDKALGDLIGQYIYSNETLSMLGNIIYGDLIGMLDTLVDGISLTPLLNDFLGVDLDVKRIGNAFSQAFGSTYDSQVISLMVNDEDGSWSKDNFYTADGMALDWGFNDRDINKELPNASANAKLTKDQIFSRSISALVSPLSFIFRYLFLDENIKLLDLINIKGYAGYQYALIPLFEMFGITNIDGLVNYKTYYEETKSLNYATLSAADKKIGDMKVVEYLVNPVLGFVHKLVAAPVTTLLTALPNLLFVLNMGGINDILNNLLHPLLVIFDIIKPVVDINKVIKPLLADIDLGGLDLNISLPLDIDLTTMINGLLDGLLGNVLTFEGVTIKLPYLDFATLCVGTVYEYMSQTGQWIVKLNSGKGRDLVTVILRYVGETLFMPENKEAVTQLLINLGKLDVIDAKTVRDIFDALYELAMTYDAPDRVLQIVYLLSTVAVPVLDELGDRFSAPTVDFSLIDFLGNISSPQFGDMFMKLMEAKESSPPISAFAALIMRIRDFFQRIIDFFKSLFGGMA